jgi:hypothetical protein
LSGENGELISISLKQIELNIYVDFLLNYPEVSDYLISNSKLNQMKKTILILVATLLSFQLVYCQVDTIIKADTVTKPAPVAADTVITPAPVAADTVTAPVEEKSRRDQRPLKERIAFGFGTSFWINSTETTLELAPVVAYRFPKRLIAGVGYKYIYRHNKDFDVNLNAYGPNVFARVDLLKSIYFWTEYETLKSEYITDISGGEFDTDKTSTDAWFVGLGWLRSVGRKGRGGLSVQVLYNVLYNSEDFSPYYGPVTYRVGFYF